MSLTSFLKLPDVRQRFSDELAIPRLPDGKKILAAPLSNRYSLVGTAFDYLLRFHLQRLNNHAICRSWVAETALASLDQVDFGGTYDLDRRKWLPSQQLRKTQRLFVAAKLAHARFIKSGRLTDDLLKACVLLAKLDVVHRAGYLDPRMGHAAKRDLKDLKHLIEIVPWQQFRSKQLCILNPTFGKASLLLDGADADLVLDDTLVEIKAQKLFKLQPEHLFQLVGYLLLNRLGLIDGLKKRPRISKLGVYFARYAELHTFDVGDIIQPRSFARLTAWFRDKATLHSKERRVDAR